MIINEVVKLLDAEVLCGVDNLDIAVSSACASDMMSDVLAFVKDQAMLLTGLCNPQVLRTAEMMDMKCVVIVRGKEPDSMMIALAKAKNITLLKTRMRLFPACGVLYCNGLGAGDVDVK